MEVQSRPDEIPVRLRIGISVRQACESTGLKQSKLYEMIKAGTVKSTKVEGRRIILVRSLLKLLNDEDEPAGDEDEPAGPAVS